MMTRFNSLASSHRVNLNCTVGSVGKHARALNKMPAAAPQTAICRPSSVNAPKSRSVTSAPSNSRRAASSGASRRSSRTARIATAPGRPARNTQNVQRGQDPRGPINGYVADRAMTGTKTDTPIKETPQAISVVGRRTDPRSKARASFDAASALRAGRSAARPSAPTRATTGSRSAASRPRTTACFSTACSCSYVCVCDLEVPAVRYRAHRHSARAPPRCSMAAAAPAASSTSISKTPPL